MSRQLTDQVFLQSGRHHFESLHDKLDEQASQTSARRAIKWHHQQGPIGVFPLTGCTHASASSPEHQDSDVMHDQLYLPSSTMGNANLTDDQDLDFTSLTTQSFEPFTTFERESALGPLESLTPDFDAFASMDDNILSEIFDDSEKGALICLLSRRE